MVLDVFSGGRRDLWFEVIRLRPCKVPCSCISEQGRAEPRRAAQSPHSDTADNKFNRRSPDGLKCLVRFAPSAP